MALRAAEASDSVQGVRPVVLVVDDDHGVRESFRLILEDRYEVLEAADGRQALERLRASPVDLVLLDIRLPEMDGIEVLERMKAVDDRVEVILVTAVKTVRIAVDAMKLGAFDYLTKPFDEDELLSLIRRALEKRPLEPELQAKLLRVLQEREVERVGGTRPVRIDARIIVATNVDLRQAVADGKFREDLYYRLNVVPVAVPPLRDRRDDVPLLVAHFVRRYTQAFNKRLEGLTPEALKALHDYPWPGNVRELQNVIERVVALVDGPVVGLNDVPLDLLLPDSRARVRDTAMLPLKHATDEFERQLVTRVLERAHWNRSEAARILGLHRHPLP